MPQVSLSVRKRIPCWWLSDSIIILYPKTVLKICYQKVFSLKFNCLEWEVHRRHHILGSMRPASEVGLNRSTITPKIYDIYIK